MKSHGIAAEVRVLRVWCVCKGWLYSVTYYVQSL